MISEDVVSVAVVTSRAEAELIAGLLRSYGIKVGVTADDAGQQEPQLQQDGVHVYVAPGDEAEAREILSTTGE
jgi:predicted Fe-Mo cluster-binding NifX family protein